MAKDMGVDLSVLEQSHEDRHAPRGFLWSWLRQLSVCDMAVISV